MKNKLFWIFFILIGGWIFISDPSPKVGGTILFWATISILFFWYINKIQKRKDIQNNIQPKITLPIKKPKS